MKKIGLALAMALVFLSCGFSYAMENNEEITVTGMLVQIVAIGGDTTGWGIELDSPMTIEGRTLHVIEIDICGKNIDLGLLEGQNVRATGKLVKHTGIERGFYWVIEVKMLEVEVMIL